MYPLNLTSSQLQFHPLLQGYNEDQGKVLKRILMSFVTQLFPVSSRYKFEDDNQGRPGAYECRQYQPSRMALVRDEEGRQCKGLFKESCVGGSKGYGKPKSYLKLVLGFSKPPPPEPPPVDPEVFKTLPKAVQDRMKFMERENAFLRKKEEEGAAAGGSPPPRNEEEENVPTTKAVKSIYVHRLICWLLHGTPASDNLQAIHTCGRSYCLNPWHLQWGTPLQNAQDRRVPRRSSLTKRRRASDAKYEETNKGRSRKKRREGEDV
jgi:hypothetical protein